MINSGMIQSALAQQLHACQQENQQLKARIARLEQQLELAQARAGRLEQPYSIFGTKHAVDADLVKDYESAVLESPQQSLAEIRAEAVLSVLDNCPAWGMMNTYGVDIEDIQQYANKLRGKP